MKFLQPAVLLFLLICSALRADAQDGPPTAEQVRGMINGQISSFNISPEPVFRVLNRKVWTGTDSVSIRIYYPADSKNLPLVFNIHGGALVAGNLETHDNISRILCNRTKSVVIALDYHRPPEHPFPAGLDESWAVFKWIVAESTALGIDKTKISFVSDSGGSLFAATIPSRMTKEKLNLQLHGQVFINPAVDLRIDKNAPPNPVYQLVTQWYLAGNPATNVEASPILTPRFTGFGSSLVIACENDELRSQATALADKLKKDAQKVKLVTIPNEDHLGGYWAAGHKKAEPAINEVINFLNGLR